MEPAMGFEPMTPSLPRTCATPALRGPAIDLTGVSPIYQPRPTRVHTRQRVGGQRRIRTPEGVSQRVYSPPRLATSVSAQKTPKGKEKPAMGLEPSTCGLQNRCSAN